MNDVCSFPNEQRGKLIKALGKIIRVLLRKGNVFIFFTAATLFNRPIPTHLLITHPPKSNPDN